MLTLAKRFAQSAAVRAAMPDPVTTAAPTRSSGTWLSATSSARAISLRVAWVSSPIFLAMAVDDAIAQHL